MRRRTQTSTKEKRSPISETTHIEAKDDGSKEQK